MKKDTGKKSKWILIILLIIGGMGFSFILSIAVILYIMAFRRKPMAIMNKVLNGADNEPTEQEKMHDKLHKETDEWLKTQRTSELTIRSMDGLKLYGTMVWAGNDAKKTVICIHGFHAEATGDFAGIAQCYVNHGINVFLADDRAHGRSEGELLGFSWKDRRDIVEWAELLINILGENCELYLHGVSMGAGAVMMASGEQDLPPQVKGIIEDCGFTSVTGEFLHVFPVKARYIRKPVVFFASVINRIVNGYWLQSASSLKQIERNYRPYLCIHGGDDTFVPTEMVYRIYNNIGVQKELFVVPKAQHAKSFTMDPEGYEKKIIEFVNKY